MTFPESLLAELERALPGKVRRDADTLREASGDFGRMVTKTPGAVVRPERADDVAAAIRFARKRRLAVATRANAHTQTGQALTEGGILLDLRGISTPLAVDAEAKTASVGSGLLWRDVVQATLGRGLVPPVLTNNLDATVGGTLSVAGLGVASWRYGAQGDNTLELEVVTGAGEVKVCSRERDPDLFFCALSGLGRFAVITRATIALRPAKPRARTYFLLYDDLGGWMEDARRLMEEARFDHLESWCSPCPQGFRRFGERKQPFAAWFYPLHATVEFDEGSPPDDARLTAGLRPYRSTHVEDGTIGEFASRLDHLFALWKRAGYWAGAHPWMETILPWETGRPYIEKVLPGISPALLGGGHVLLWPARRETSNLPLFKVPESPCALGFGILPGIPLDAVPEVQAAMNRLSDLSMQAGAKRYLSGWVQFDAARWKAHYGETWAAMQEWKRTYDPDRVLNPGFLAFE